MSIIMLIAITLVLAGTSLAAVTPQSDTIPMIEKDYFTAAVYEHVRLGNLTTDTPAEIVAKNFDYYNRAAETARSKGADIIVFPEYGLFPAKRKREDIRVYLETIPDHKQENWNPCEQTEEFSERQILRRLSCMARENGIVVVSSMGDIQPCTKEQDNKCPDDGFWHHNAIVAFDRNGTLIGVSRKEHLLFEQSMDVPTTPQDHFFKTDFGTFAMYISFDSIFKSMALSGRNTSIDAVISSLVWFDYRPLYSAVQHFSSWAIGTGANLIAPNVQIKGYISTGSGIFSGKMGALKYTFNTDNQPKLIVSRVPKNRNQERETFHNDDASITVITSDGSKPYDVDEDGEGQNIPDICYYKLLGKDYNKGYRCFQEPTADYTFKRLSGTNGTVEACNNGLCCTLTYEADSMNESFYLGVFNGTHNSFDRYHWCEEKCFVVRCDHFNGSECNTFPSHSETVFKRLELKSNFTTSFVYSSVLKRGFRLSPVDEWDFNVEDDVGGSYCGRLTYESDKNKPMLVASLNARCYDRDPPHNGLRTGHFQSLYNY